MASERELPPLNRQPEGLLSWLGIKNGGRNPQTLIPTLQPVLELWPHLTVSGREYYSLAQISITGALSITDLTVTGIAPAAPLPDILVGGFIVVPQDEVWYCESFEVSWTLPAEAAAYCDCQWIFGALRVAQTLQGWTTGTATGARGGRRTTERPFWLGPGSNCIAQALGSNSAGNISTASRIAITRLQI